MELREAVGCRVWRTAGIISFLPQVHVTDENDNSPVFEQHIYQVMSLPVMSWPFLHYTAQGHIPENSKAGTVVLLAKKILAVDPDTVDREGVTLQLYGKDSDKFSLDPSTGEVILATEPLNREEKEVASLIHTLFIPPSFPPRCTTCGCGPPTPPGSRGRASW